MGAEVKYVVVYEEKVERAEFSYGVTAQEAMQCFLDNGPIGSSPVYAFDPRNPKVKYYWDGEERL